MHRTFSVSSLVVDSGEVDTAGMENTPNITGKEETIDTLVTPETMEGQKVEDTPNLEQLKVVLDEAIRAAHDDLMRAMEGDAKTWQKEAVQEGSIA